MKLTTRVAVTAMSLLAIMYANQACKKDNNSTASTPPASIQLATNASFGKILTDSSGRTLYFFAIDANGNSGCTSSGCLAAWPIFYKAKPTLDTALAASDFGTITRTDGLQQTTYKGWPLYYFDNDLKAGDVNGDAVGGTWFVAKPDYSVMLASTQLVGEDSVKYNSSLQPGTGNTQYLTDPYGQTLYAFSPDKFKKNTYTKSDFSNNAFWPVDTIATIKNIPSVLSKAQFDTLTVFGKVQLAYKGWPLYYFGSDKRQRGSTKGVSVPHPGVWPVVNSSSATAPVQ